MYSYSINSNFFIYSDIRHGDSNLGREMTPNWVFFTVPDSDYEDGRDFWVERFGVNLLKGEIRQTSV